MSIFSIMFLDGKKIAIEADSFSVAKVKAAYQRMEEGSTRHIQLAVDDLKSATATKKARGFKQI